MNEIFDLVVIGGGPAGYTCSMKASQLGLKVACIESRKNLGGTCLNEGCIPSKTLLNNTYHYSMVSSGKLDSLGIRIKGVELNLKDMMQHKETVISNLAKGIDWLFKKNGVVRFYGIGQIISCENEIKKVSVSGFDNTGSNDMVVLGKNIVIATGSEVASITGVNFDHATVVSSSGALSFDKVPNSLIVIGGGVIGLEISSIWSRLGCEVTVIEYCEKLAPFLDAEVSTCIQKSLEKQSIRFLTGRKVDSISLKADKAEVSCSTISSGEITKLVADKVLVAAGRKPYYKNIGVPVLADSRGFILTNEKFETSIKSVYAIGDATTGPMLAHKAEEDGVILAEIIAGKKFHHKALIPAVIYTHPEVAYVGKNEQDLLKEGVKYKVGKFPFSANSRAVANSDTEGFVKILVNEFDTILGVHIISSQAATLIGEAVVAMEYGASAEDIAHIIHSHPDLNEAIKEASLIASFGKSLNS